MLGTLLSSLGALADVGMNFYKTKYNEDTNARDFQYQKDLQQQIFAREDNAVQRRAADLEAAGMNPFLAAGSAAGAGQVVARSSTNDINPGSYLDTMMAYNTIKQQRIETQKQKEEANNAKLTGQILQLQKDRQSSENQIFDNFTSQKIISDICSELGLPVSAYIRKGENGNYFELNLDDDYHTKYIPYSRKNAERAYDMSGLEYDYQEDMNKVMQSDADWATAGKFGQLISLLLKALK